MHKEEVLRNIYKQVIEALKRALDFVLANPLPDGGEYGAPRALLEDVLSALNEHTTSQASGGRQQKQEREREEALSRALRNVHLLPISLIAKASMREKPGIQRALKMPRPQLTTTKLIADAKAIREVAATYEQEFIQLRRPVNFLAQLDQAIADLDAAHRGKATQLGRRVGGSEGLVEEITRGREALKLLDALIITAFARKPDVLARWRMAKRIRGLPSGGGSTTGGTADENLSPAA
jgi:hypothetical protein